MKKKEIFLLMGQSNMAGRGLLSESPSIEDPQIEVFKNNEWIPAVEPLHSDNAEAGIGLAMSFAKSVRAHEPGSTVQLVPCAVGSTCIDDWLEGPIYDKALSNIKNALQGGELKAILWLQGESDCSHPINADLYLGKLEQFVVQIRAELNHPDIPFISGELPDFLKQGGRFQHIDKINRAISLLETKIPHYRRVKTNGLTPNRDNIHFDSKSLRILGHRYFDAYLSIPI
ncbi:sialate O-acetylesterase [Shewanella surugensis]|uniref:Sialate O-acetylesterase n=1 Tax=Shewanella surugensis TaxID=212020 RepID=A0ABT0LCJ8_9GAMM|nr:sialate O-acetylesterase [Shewanella surugensis]MCL1125205.1 sialate O-acetylesterase [Shewanella surugensis]